MNPNVLAAVSKGIRVGSKTTLQQNPPVLNWVSRLTKVVLYTSRETGVEVAAAAAAAAVVNVVSDSSILLSELIIYRLVSDVEC